MAVGNGGIIGIYNETSNVNTSGVFTVNEHLELFRAGLWAENVIPDPYETLTILTNQNITVVGNNTSNVTFYKVSGSASWDSHAYSTQGFTAPVTLEFFKNAADSGDNGNSYGMIGLNTDPTTNADYGTLDYAAYPYSQSSYSVYNNGSQVLSGGAWNKNNRFYITYETDGTTKHYNGSTLLYTVNRGTGLTVYLDSSMYSPNITFNIFSGVRIIKKIWNGASYV